MGNEICLIAERDVLLQRIDVEKMQKYVGMTAIRVNTKPTYVIYIYIYIIYLEADLLIQAI